MAGGRHGAGGLKGTGFNATERGKEKAWIDKHEAERRKTAVDGSRTLTDVAADMDRSLIEIKGVVDSIRTSTTLQRPDLSNVRKSAARLTQLAEEAHDIFSKT